MNEVNFIKSISPQRQESLNRWFKLSALLGALILLALLLVTCFKTYKLFSIKRNHQSAQQAISNLETDLQKYEVIKKEQTKLGEQQTKITRLKNSPKNPGIYLKELSGIIPGDVSLTNYKQSPDNSVELEGTTHRTNAATTFLHALNQSLYFKNMQLISLQNHAQENNDSVFMQFKIKGQIA